MAEIPVEKKSNLTWLWILLALILVALLIWWATSGDEEGFEDPVTVVAEEPLGVEQPLPAPVATAEGITIGNILGSPATYVGREDFQAEVMVTEVPTDRGFWIEDEGQRLFALIIDEPREVPLDINAGQELRISRGTLRDGTYISQIPGDSLDADTRRIIDEQDVFLVVNEENIEVLSRPN